MKKMQFFLNSTVILGIFISLYIVNVLSRHATHVGITQIRTGKCIPTALKNVYYIAVMVYYLLNVLFVFNIPFNINAEYVGMIALNVFYYLRLKYAFKEIKYFELSNNVSNMFIVIFICQALFWVVCAFVKNIQLISILYCFDILISVLIGITFRYKIIQYIINSQKNISNISSNILINMYIKYINCVSIIIISSIVLFIANILYPNDLWLIIDINIRIILLHLQFTNMNKYYHLLCNPCRIEFKESFRNTIKSKYNIYTIPSISSTDTFTNINISNPDTSTEYNSTSTSTVLTGVEPTKSSDIINANDHVLLFFNDNYIMNNNDNNSDCNDNHYQYRRNPVKKKLFKSKLFSNILPFAL